MSYMLAIKTADGTYKYSSVSEEVYTYVRQLEAAVQFPKSRRAIRRLYPYRFTDATREEIQ